MGTTFYIHIGIHKTGSTSIQHSMAENRDLLLARGINYLPIDRNHGPLFISLLSKRPHEDVRNVKRYIDTPERAASFNARNNQRLTEALASNQSPKVVISGEGLSMIGGKKVQRLKQMFEPYATAYRIIVYARDPYDYANSASLQQIKGGRTLDNPAPRLPLPNHQRRIAKYIRIFGRENVNIRIFDPARFAGGSLISDFLVALEEPPELADSLKIVRANESMSHEAAMILSAANAEIPILIDKRANRARASAFHLVVAGIKGEKFSIDPNAYVRHETAVAVDLAWLHRALREPVFGRSAPRHASVPTWSQVTVDSVKSLIQEMAQTIRELKTARPRAFGRAGEKAKLRRPGRVHKEKDYSQAVNPDLDSVVLPPELAWLRESIGQAAASGAPPAAPHFDQATVRSLSRFIHGMALTIERLKGERAARPRLLSRLGIGG